MNVKLFYFLDQLHSFSDGLLVLRNEVVVSFRKSLAESSDDAVDLDDRTDCKQTSEDNHVESLDEVHFCRCIHGVNPVDLDILPCRWF